MITLSRTQKRARKKSLRKYHKSFLRDGLPKTGSRELGASLALLFRDQLAASEAPNRVLVAMQTAHTIFELTDTNNIQNSKLPCCAGCHFCCFTQVSVLAPEALLIAEHLSCKQETTKPAASQMFSDVKDPEVANDDASTNQPNFGPCPLLTDRMCSIYQYRPIMCRRHASHSLAACEQEFYGEGTDIPADAEKRVIGEACLIGFAAALKSLNLPHRTYDLRQSVAVLLDTENALNRWSGGEDVLSPINSEGPISAKIEALIDEMAEIIS